MSEQRYRYGTMAISEGYDEPVFLLGKRKAEFEFKGRDWERTATLKLPRKMSQTEFDAWKDSDEVNLIDMYLHCIHQNDPQQKPEPNEQLMTDGGSPSIPEEEIEHRCGGARKQLEILKEKVGENWLSGYLVSAIEQIDEAEEMLKGEAPVDREPEPVTDGGSSMPKLALETLKELKSVGDRLGDLLSEMTGEELESFSDIYSTEHSRPEANNEIELGGGFSLREAEYAELLGILEQSRAAAADDPIPLGVRNRLLMNVILANPEEYARVKADELERRREAQEEARQRFNEAVGRQRMNERMADLNDGVDIPIGGDEEEQ